MRPANHQPLEHDLIAAISGGTENADPFERLALRVFNYQYQHNLPYRNYCDCLGCLGSPPDHVTRWQDIPALPTDAFKQHNHPLSTFPPQNSLTTFHTSGTTTETKGHHHFPSTTLYDLSILQAWKEASLPTPHHAIYLTATPNTAPHSSLAHMMGVLDKKHSSESRWIIGPDGEIASDAINQVTEEIAKATSAQQPIALLGTALAFLSLFDQIQNRLILPPGSWVMETGGYKGTQRSLTKGALYSLFKNKLGIPTESIVNEYSMTELSSQFYTRGLGAPHTGPHWTRIRVVDPATGSDAAPGTPGYLIIYDLANLHSVMAIQTQDIAIAHDDNSFTLLGRDPSALPRGCSRSV